MLNDTHETAPNRSVQAGDVQFAYRRFGPRGAAPLLLLNYFAAHMDDWDPKITNGFAEEHDVILVDYPGIGKSSGQTPSNVAALTNACLILLSCLFAGPGPAPHVSPGHFSTSHRG